MKLLCSLRSGIASGHTARSGQRTGLSLIEMLVAMALSLLVILAVTQAFQMVGDNVLASRAILEMSGQLRGVSGQLQSDLAGVTVPARPWPDAASAPGYLEYYEGPMWDMGMGSTPHAESSVGDVDDVLLFTSRAVGRPFVGQILGQLVYDPNSTRPRLVFDPTQTTTIESRVAEIAWFTRFNDLNGNSEVDAGEVTLHRRQLLVLPALDLSDSSIQALSPGQFYNAFDISVRYQQSASSSSWEKVANSLADLSRRENRLGHNIAGGYPIDPSGSLIVREHPYFLSRALLVPQGTIVTLGDDGAPGVSGINDDGNRTADGSSSVDDLGEAGHFLTDDRTEPIEDVLPAFSDYGEPIGNDVMLSYVLAFDVKVFDPQAKLQASADGTDALLPGDAGYDPRGSMIGQGGYVDLFYARYLPDGWPDSDTLPLGTQSEFAGPPHVKSGLFSSYINETSSYLNNQQHPAVYDTWSFSYEHDGIDQPVFALAPNNRNRVQVSPNGDGVVDNATNGFDDVNEQGFRIHGVDDIGERETAPPYPVPLRGIQVRFRVIDNDTRQVRQVTVASDFIPE